MGQRDTDNVLEKLTYDYYHDYLLKSQSRDEAMNLVARCNGVAADRDNDDIRFEALMMVLQLAQDLPADDSVRTWCDAADRLVAGYIDSPNICRMLEDYGILSTELRLKADQYKERIVANTQSAAAVAGCQYALLSEYLVKEQYGGGLTNEERVSTIERLCALRESYGRELNPNPRLHFGLTFAEVADSDIFELENLRVGSIAPDIEGEDAEGVPFRLSDYRGKVVLLKFWGDW